MNDERMQAPEELQKVVHGFGGILIWTGGGFRTLCVVGG
jgi:hypothetical protein